jgi:hypothetical protein
MPELAPMVTMDRLLLFAALFAFVNSANMVSAQEALSEEMRQEVAALQGRVDQFFRQLADKTMDPERPVREIVGTGPLRDRNEEISKLIDQMPMLDQRYGAYTGHEVAAVKAIGSDLVFLRYLYKAERFPVIWYFVFYRTPVAGGLKRDWTLISLRFDTKIEMLEK